MGSSGVAGDDGYFLPELPGDKPDFWEGPQWDALGFFVQYLWAFGIGFAVSNSNARSLAVWTLFRVQVDVFCVSLVSDGFLCRSSI